LSKEPNLVSIVKAKEFFTLVRNVKVPELLGGAQTSTITKSLVTRVMAKVTSRSPSGGVSSLAEKSKTPTRSRAKIAAVKGL
jgi:hypothetical protein